MSGVLFAGLAFGKAMVLSDVGGFRELVEEHGAGRARAAGRPGRARAPRSRGLLADPRRAARLEERAAAAAAGPVLVGPDRRANRRVCTSRCAREGRVHGEVQALGGAGARLARERGRRGGGRGRRPSRTRSRATSSAWTSWPSGTACRSRPTRSCTRAPARRRRPRDLVPVLEADPRAAPVARPRRLPELPPGAAAGHPRPRRLQRRRARGHDASGACPATSWTPDFDTGDLVEVERFPIDPETATAFSVDLESQEHLLGLFKRVMRRALAGEELPRTPQGEGRYVSARGVRVAPPRAAGRRPRAQAARLLVPALPGRADRGGRPGADAR